jgi:hypothetical protein
MKKQQTESGANSSNISVHAVHFVTSEAYAILPACPDLYHGSELPSRTAFCWFKGQMKVERRLEGKKLSSLSILDASSRPNHPHV